MRDDGEIAMQAEAPGRADDVARLFADVFDMEAVGPDDDFFQLGGDSLVGASLMTAIEKRFGLVLSISVLLEAATPRALAAAIFAENAARAVPCLINVNPGGAPPAIFCVHGNVGESVAPLQLSGAMPARRLYGFRASGLEAGEPALTTVEAMANTYLAGMALAEPGGGFVLLGHCAGAIVAYEMARLLAARDTPAAGLILIDPEISDDFAPYLHRSGMALTLLQASWRKRAAQLDAAMAENPNPTGEMRRKIVRAGIKHAVGTYTPLPYGGPTLLMCSPERKAALLDRRRGYPALAGDLDVVELGVGHGELFSDGLAEIAGAVERFVGRLAV